MTIAARIGCALLAAGFLPCAQAAALDPTFGNGGFVVTDLGAESTASAVALQGDGKVVIAGTRGGTYNATMLVARYLSNGNLDPAFNGGTLTVPGPSSYSQGYAIALQSDGAIVVAGAHGSPGGSGTGSTDYPLLARVTVAGALDTTFGGSGLVLPSGVFGIYNAVALQPDGKIVAAGSDYTPGFRNSHLDYRIAAARHNMDGSPDTGFGGGRVNTFEGTFARGLAVQADGAILIAGVAYVQSTQSYDVALVRYGTGGTLEASGLEFFRPGYNDVRALALQGNRSLVGVGNDVAGILRFSAPGVLDPSFGSAGKFAIPGQPIVGIALQPDGKIVALTADYDLLRLTADGTLDSTFGWGGRYNVQMAVPATAAGLALQQDGKLVIAGQSAGHVALARVDPVAASGFTLDPPFLDFGGQSMGTTSPPRAATLTNTGPSPVTISSVAEPGNMFAIVHDCATLAPAASCTVQVAFVALGSGARGGFVAIQTSAGRVTIPVAGTGEGTLTTHYYRSILRRDPDAPGKAFWDGEASRLSGVGVNPIETWFAMAMSFYGSPEYASFARDDAGFVTDLYHTFFNRAPDEPGFGFWVGQIHAGMPREVVLATFMFSTEFANFVQMYYGNPPMRAEVGMVADFYRGLLSRLPDSGGLGHWVAQFRDAQCRGAGAVQAMAELVSNQFTQSGEYAARARNDSQYVGDLYNSFLRRGGDLDGVQFWIGQLTSGASSREQARGAFVASAEFSARVTAVVNQGCL